MFFNIFYYFKYVIVIFNVEFVIGYGIVFYSCVKYGIGCIVIYLIEWVWIYVFE